MNGWMKKMWHQVREGTMGIFQQDENNLMFIPADIIEDYNSGLEYATARQIIDVVQVGTARRFKVEWNDSYPVSIDSNNLD